MIIEKNSVKCHKCGTVLISIIPEAKIVCSCGCTTIWGGTENLCRQGGPYSEQSKFLISEDPIQRQLIEDSAKPEQRHLLNEGVKNDV